MSVLFFFHFALRQTQHHVSTLGGKTHTTAHDSPRRPTTAHDGPKTTPHLFQRRAGLPFITGLPFLPFSAPRALFLHQRGPRCLLRPGLMFRRRRGPRPSLCLNKPFTRHPPCARALCLRPRAVPAPARCACARALCLCPRAVLRATPVGVFLFRGAAVPPCDFTTSKTPKRRVSRDQFSVYCQPVPFSVSWEPLCSLGAIYF